MAPWEIPAALRSPCIAGGYKLGTVVSRQAHVFRGQYRLNGKLRTSPRILASVSAVDPGPVSDPGQRGTSAQRAGVAVRPARGGRDVKVVREISLALAVYGMAGWIYVGLCALAAPATLELPLTHLMPSLREDTAGVLSFIVSFLGFLSYRITRRD